MYTPNDLLGRNSFPILSFVSPSRLRRGFVLEALVFAAGLLVPLLLTTAAWAQDATQEAGVGQKASVMFRTLKEMQASDAAHPTIPAVIPPNLPTMDFQKYLDLKGAGPAPGQVKPGAGLAPLPEAPPSLGPLRCNGIGQLDPQAGGSFPPDTHGAVGANHYGQVVNTAIRFYTKNLTGNCPTSIVMNVTLASFFNYFTRGLTDPRLLYDLTYNRWVVSVEAFPESSTVQYQFIAVSVDSDPTHGFFLFGDAGGPVSAFNARNWVGANVFWDYPQIGYDEDAVILTGNKFIGVSYVGSTAVFFSKHRMYAGLGFSYCFFNSARLNVGTLTPSIVLDQGPYTTVASAALNAGFIRVTKWNNTDHVCPNLLGSNDIAVSTNVPPLAQQPGFTDCSTGPGNTRADCLDTLDGRFQSQGTQFGTPAFGAPVKFWQVRTNGEFGFPIPHAYRVNADAATIEENCFFFLSRTSFDFNPSIVVNGAGTSFVTWSATDPPNNINAQVRMSGKRLADGCILGPGVLVNQSANPLTGNFDSDKGFQRWGDTSAITLDPFNPTIVYGVNEKVRAGSNPTTWRSFFFNAHNP
jgi:hypothetical protein